MARATFLNARKVELFLAVTAVGSALVMIAGAALGARASVTAGAGVFGVAAMVSALVALLEPWRARAAEPPSVMRRWGRLRQFTPLQTIAYAWGAVAIQGVYLTPLTGLKWQHGWQYALAMGLLAVLCVWYLKQLWPPPVPDQDSDKTAAWVRLGLPMAAVQGLSAAGLLTWLAVSGKLLSERSDWAANRVFAGLAIATIAISLASVLAHHSQSRGTLSPAD